jgi:diguanylate cyclase (GGDEF)-like protein
MGLRIFSSLRYRLLLLVLLAVLPALALILSTAWEQRRQSLQGALDDALRLARESASDNQRLIEGARSLLTGLAQLSAVQMHNSKACSALFAEVQRRFPLYVDIGAIRPDGQVFCAARAGRGFRVADPALFERALRGQEFAVNGYVRDPRTGRLILTLAHPAIDAAGSVWAVVFAELDLGWMARLAARANFPPGTALTVTDATGIVLARYPDPGQWTGRSLAERSVFQAIKQRSREGTIEAAGPDGIPRLFAFAPLFVSPHSEASAFVIVAIPRAAVLADADRLLIRNLLWIGLVIVLMLIAATIVSDLFILRRLNGVVSAARRLTEGDLRARAPARGGDEIATMARTFNVMAERLEVRVSGEEALTAALALRVNELDLLNRMGEMFQACVTLDEAYGVIGRLAPQLFPTEAGAVFSVRPELDRAEAVASWGASPLDRRGFSVDECWALRDGRTHVVEDTTTGVTCKHLPSPAPPAYLCTPLPAQGGSLGVLYVASETGDRAAASELGYAKQRLAEAVAAQLSLALANVQLRETLRSQSIHDPLTGLFNRRYMEETLQRELHRAQRARRPMSVLMADVDGFKQQNDAFGHSAGDAVLRELGALLLRNLRKEDIACRYGGEEFVLVLPDAALENGARRAEQLRLAVKQMRVVHNDLTIGPVTISIGVSAFPEHGADAEALLRAADAALYLAKHQGRDRVTLAKEIEHSSPD